MIERKFNESLLLEFKENESDEIFEKIMNDKDLKKYVYYVCHQKMRSYPSTLMSFEDFTNIGYLVIWQCIQNYKFICPECGIGIKTETIYKLHTSSKHGKFIEPEKSISEYIKFNLGAYLQNELRKEYSSSRKSNIMTDALFSPEEDEDFNFSGIKEFEISKTNMEDDVIFENCMIELTNLFDDFTKDIFVYLFKYELKQIEVAKILFDQNKYASEQSAAVVISRILKNKIYPTVKRFFE